MIHPNASIAPAAARPEPGIYRGMPDEEYRSLDALSNSDLMAWAQPDRSIDPRNAIWGTAMHGLCFEPEVAAKKLVRLEERQQRKSYTGPSDMWVMTYSEYGKMYDSYKSAEADPIVGQLIKYARSNRDRCEVVVVWEDDKTGILRKSKLDLHTDDWLYDLKTTNSTREGFAGSISDFNYDQQAAYYLDAATAADLGVGGFRFACLSKRGDLGYPCWVQDVTEEQLAVGRRLLNTLLGLYARHMETANEDQ